MAAIIVLAILGFLVAFAAVLVLIGLRLRRHGSRTMTVYVAALAGLGLVFGIAGLVLALPS